jgi:hypothetical protein
MAKEKDESHGRVYRDEYYDFAVGSNFDIMTSLGLKTIDRRTW